MIQEGQLNIDFRITCGGNVAYSIELPWVCLVTWLPVDYPRNYPESYLFLGHDWVTDSTKHQQK